MHASAVPLAIGKVDISHARVLQGVLAQDTLRAGGLRDLHLHRLRMDGRGALYDPHTCIRE